LSSEDRKVPNVVMVIASLALRGPPSADYPGGRHGSPAFRSTVAMATVDGVFRDRADAGHRLASALTGPWHRPIVLGLPRGGVPVAAVVADELDAVLDVFVARKIGAPGHPELGIGAIAEGDVVVTSDTVRLLRVADDDLQRRIEAERRELARRVERYRGDRSLPRVHGADVVLVDDGLATGVTAEAALRALRSHGPARLVLAVPVGAADTVRRLRAIADEVVCVEQPPQFQAVGQWYRDFAATTDDEVLRHLAGRARSRDGRP
jgi:predicted phosphoribosyltransferase